MQWMRDKPQGQEAWGSAERTCYILATRGGHINVLNWLRQQQPPCHMDPYFCREAAKYGQLEVLRWLRQQEPPCPWNAEACDLAACNGHIDVLRWLRQQEPPCPWDE